MDPQRQTEGSSNKLAKRLPKLRSELWPKVRDDVFGEAVELETMDYHEFGGHLGGRMFRQGDEVSGFREQGYHSHDASVAIRGG